MKDLDKELEDLATQISTRELIITVDTDGTPELDSDAFTDWELAGLARWLQAKAEQNFEDEDED